MSFFKLQTIMHLKGGQWMTRSYVPQLSRFKSLSLAIGIGLSLLFLFVSYAQADGPIVDLSQDEQDVVVRGDTTDGWLGEVTGVADFNSDGFDDLLIGAAGVGYNGQYSGAAYMILGSATLTPTINLTTTLPNLSVYGAAAGDKAGHSVAGSDVNGDGYADMIIGADGYDSDRGATYVVLGHDGGFFSTPITIDLAITSTALTILGHQSSGERMGRSVAGGDLNNDGLGDIVIGAYYASPGGRSQAGAVYVILGNSDITSTTPSTIDLTSTAAALTIYGGEAGDRLGRSVTIGDVNGDAIADIIVGAYRANNVDLDVGKTYVFYGSETYTTTSPITIDLSIASADVTVTGIDAGDESGFYVGSGDVNNDGYDDVVIGAYQSSGYGNAFSGAGEAYVVYGAGSLSGNISLPTGADVVVYGAASGDRLGRSLASGDVNADGYDDLVLGASRADPDGRGDAGRVYVIYGGSNISSTILLSDTTSANIHILGDEQATYPCVSVSADCSDEAGRATSAGDISGDGVDDIIVGALYANNGSIVDAGAAYVVYGSAALSVSLSPPTATITAGQSITYTLTASNTFGTWDVTGLGVFTITPAANGGWAGSVYTGHTAGTWTVTGTFQSLAATAVLTVEHATPASIAVAPDPETVTAGGAVTYTALAEDAYGNTWDVTGSTSFSTPAGAGGSWVDNVYTSQTAGTWTVTGTYQTLTDTASLTVEPGPAVSLDIAPDAKTVTAGGAVTYTTVATDAYGNAWDATSATGFSITPGAGGSWNGNTYASEVAGTWTVTSTYQTLVDTAVLTVEHGPLSSVSVAPASVDLDPSTQQVFTAAGYDSYGNPIPGLSFNWSIQNGGGQIDSSPTGVTAVTVTAVVTDDTYFNTLLAGETGSGITGTATIVVNNVAPTASISGTYSGDEGSPIVFTGSGTDANNDPLTYDWDFGDGGTAVGPTPTYTYTDDGTYTVMLTVTDDDSATDVSTTTVTINNVAPTGVISAPLTAGGGETVTFDGSQSSDPGVGDSLSFAWDFDHDGDFSDATGAVVSHSFVYAGTYSVRLRVDDGDGGQDVVTHTIEITSNASDAYTLYLPIIFR